MLTTYILVAAVAYLLGSIPFGYILVRLFTGADVRAQGSGNIGATNVARTGRKGLAIATLLLDALKGCNCCLVRISVRMQTSSGLYDRSNATFLSVIASLLSPPYSPSLATCIPSG